MSDKLRTALRGGGSIRVSIDTDGGGDFRLLVTECWERLTGVHRLTIPAWELDEAAAIDGCSFFQIYYKIILPVLKPVLATVALLSFRSAWNEFIMPQVFTMSNPKMRPLTVGVVALKTMGDGAAAWNIMFAGSAMSIVPIIIVYLFTSRYFMSGLTVGAVKG